VPAPARQPSARFEVIEELERFVQVSPDLLQGVLLGSFLVALRLKLRTHLLAKNQPQPSAAENLEELAWDVQAGRDQKQDFRTSAEEKLLYTEAARATGLTTSEWMRQALAAAAHAALASAVGAGG
jgi:hypothetical protein